MVPTPKRSGQITTPRLPARFPALVGRVFVRHALPLFLYSMVSIGVSWPLIRNFGTKVIGDNAADPRHSMWVLWHVKEWILGRDSLFYTKMLYYPQGVSLRLEAVGPLSGFLALPFWHWGPIGAYNGAVLVGLALSGYCMYLAALGLGLDFAASIFAGLLFLLSPMHVAAICCHVEKTFIGLVPLTMLAAIRAIGPKRNRTWAVITAALMLANLLYSATYFAFCAVAIALVYSVSLSSKRVRWDFRAIGDSGEDEFHLDQRSDGENESEKNRTPSIWANWRIPILRRMTLTVAATAIVVSPVLYRVFQYEHNPAYFNDIAGLSRIFSPDLSQFVVPGYYTRIGGRLLQHGLYPKSLLAGPGWYGSGVETAVNIYLIVFVLCVAALFLGKRSARLWLLFACFFLLLSVGSDLRVLGSIILPSNGLGRFLPYSLMADLPGFRMMRTPGRFSMMAAVGISIAAAAGLRAVSSRYLHWRMVIYAAAVVLLFVEAWPRVWMQRDPLPVPRFYEQLAKDDGEYGVLDLPAPWLGVQWWSGYMYYQIFHRKPIAWGYLSRGYLNPPLPAIKQLLDGTIAPDALQPELRKMGFKYVVWHKHASSLYLNIPAFPDTPNEAFLERGFEDNPPVIDDDLVRVWKVNSGANQGSNRQTGSAQREGAVATVK